jgi:hypothetical protein
MKKIMGDNQLNKNISYIKKKRENKPWLLDTRHQDNRQWHGDDYLEVDNMQLLPAYN